MAQHKVNESGIIEIVRKLGPLLIIGGDKIPSNIYEVDSSIIGVLVALFALQRRRSVPSLFMICPKCFSKTKVIDSREREEGDLRFQVYRRRECEKGHRFSTREIIKNEISRNAIQLQT